MDWIIDLVNAGIALSKRCVDWPCSGNSIWLGGMENM